MNNATLSVILPVYNTDKNLLTTCIESILSSSFSDFEIIIVDDGSKTDIAAFCDDCKRMDSRILVFHTSNKGVSCARNFGLQQARGQYISFVDADDTIERDLFKTLYELIEKKHADIAVAGYREHYSNGKIVDKTTEKGVFSLERENILKSFFEEDEIIWAVWGKLYRKSILTDVRFPEGRRTGEDMFFIYQACLAANILVKVDKPLYNYSINPTSVMNEDNIDKLMDTYQLIKAIKDDVSISPKFDEPKKYFFVRKAIWLLRILVKKANKDEQETLAKIRDEIVLNTNKSVFNRLSFSRKMEFLVLKTSFSTFKAYAKRK